MSKYGYEWGPKNYSGIAIVRAAKEWSCGGAVTEADEDDGFQGMGNSWDAFFREQECDGNIRKGDVHVRCRTTTDGTTYDHRCCLQCALTWGVLVPSGAPSAGTRNETSDPGTKGSESVYVLGPDPLDGCVVLLRLADAEYVRDISELLSSDLTVGDFDVAITRLTGASPYDEVEAGDREEGWRDELFDISDVPGYGETFPPQTGTIMLDTISDDVLDMIDGLYEVQDDMGRTPRLWISPESQQAIADRLLSVGIHTVDWATICEPRRE